MGFDPKRMLRQFFQERGLGRFELLDLINSGSMSEMRKAIDRQSGRVLCVKLYNRDGQFMREAIEKKHPEIRETILSIRHPNLLHTYEIGMEGKRMYAVLEYIEGSTLGRAMRGDFPPFAWWFEILKQIVTAMRYLHEESKLVHRDFNPYNVMIAAGNLVKIVDLDFAYPIGSDATGLYRRSGTLGYMAPEQVKGLVLDERVDVYSFGASVYEMLTRQNPFRDTSSDDRSVREERSRAKHLQVLPSAPSKHNPLVPSEFDAIVMKCLEQSRLDRYNNFAEIQAAMEAIEPKIRPSV
ncbi:MAG: serine/threonine-protein kinase [Planctomycetota bacterium]